MTNEKSFGTKLGQLMGHVFAGCVTACLCATMIALAVRFIMWIF